MMSGSSQEIDTRPLRPSALRVPHVHAGSVLVFGFVMSITPAPLVPSTGDWLGTGILVV